ncbi:guanine nucleotide-binding protein subunit alpha [Physocladia obscura]|uniref:Guanine nucleotide-binding protein subunit alpha n=1 Tax=Physocladia obscura TaxID=109957 RepID=A0AAD5XMR8_9FUNG|nr:guanine nucleotide-binding protein subunit alpha [Physocladia obscura]
MGQCTSDQSVENREASTINRDIDKRIKLEQESLGSTVKLLLLGAGETGKSTVLKQLKLIHGIGFTSDERKTFRSAIILNIMTCAKTLVKAMAELKIPYGYNPVEDRLSDPQRLQYEKYTSRISATSVDRNVTSQTVQISSDTRLNSIEMDKHENGVSEKRLETVASITQCNFVLENKIPEFARLIEGCDITFCFGSENVVPGEIVEAILSAWKDSGADFIPTDQDILAARILTTRVSDIKFMVQDIQFVVYDLGGQRSERKKWIPYFDSVQAILFLVAISSYDQVCFEDNETNRNKLEVSPVQTHFPSFTGANTFENASEYFSRQFLCLNKFPEKKMYVHFTWATDTKQISKVLATVNHIILSD